MKNNWKNLIAAVLFTFSATFIFAQNDEQTGYPGDNFSLEGALELFKKAESPEDFEKALNSEDNYVNNLDLDEDGNTDYVRVIDNMDGNVHAIVLQVPVNKEEYQDIAVIEIEKTGKENAILQIVGDETIYGEQTIVEPFEEEAERGGKGGPSVNMATTRLVINVWGWPSIRFIYGPRYRVWVSPWRFGVYPRWYRPWRPRPWNVWRPRVTVFAPRYHVVRTHRVVRAHRVYTPVRRTSKVVTTRTTTRVARTKNGNVVAGKKTTTVTKRPNGKVATRTTTQKGAVVSKNGKKAAVGQKRTTQRAQTNRGTVTRNRTTRTGVKKGKKGAVGKKRTTTTVRRRKN